MNITYKNKIVDLLEVQRYDEFLLVLEEIAKELDEEKRQNLLELIVDCYFTRQYQLKFKRAFDLLIGSDLDLNFNVDSWGASFLSLVILRIPSIPVFDYFLGKGAVVNFIGDNRAFEDGKFLKEEDLNGRYETCLDFIELRLADLLLIDYSYTVPEKKINGYYTDSKIKGEKITITKEEYLYLHEQSEYLHTLIETGKLKDHIVRLGGKTYRELMRKPAKQCI